MSGTARAGRAPFRLPSPQEHLSDLRRRPQALLALLHNAVPVLGILALGWSLPLVVFTYWFDGLAGLAAILALVMPRLLREVEETKHRGPVGKLFYGLFTWLVVLGIVGMPYWIVLIPLGGTIWHPEVLAQIRTAPDVWVTLALIVGGHVATGVRRGYGALPEKGLKQALRWDVYLLVLRAVAMFVAAGNLFPQLVVPVLALAFTYMEIWPANALGIVFGDPSRLHEHDPDGGRATPPPSPRRRRKR